MSTASAKPSPIAVFPCWTLMDARFASVRSLDLVMNDCVVAPSEKMTMPALSVGSRLSMNIFADLFAASMRFGL